MKVLLEMVFTQRENSTFVRQRILEPDYVYIELLVVDIRTAHRNMPQVAKTYLTGQ